MELATLRVMDHQPAETFSALVCIHQPIPAEGAQLTGIQETLLRTEGRPLEEVFPEFLSFVGTSRVVCHHATFDYAFLTAACRRCHLPEFRNPYADTLQLARRVLDDRLDYKLTTLAAHLGIDISAAHRALADCHLIFAVFEKLNEIR